MKKYYKVTVCNRTTGEVCEISRYDDSPALALSHVIRKIKGHFYTLTELNAARFVYQIEEMEG